MAQRLLIIRFSSFGDILQAMTVPQFFKKKYPNAEVHWAVRSDFAELLSHHPFIDKVWPLDRSKGIKGLLKYTKNLKKMEWTHIYDAHNNLRSHIICSLLKMHPSLRRNNRRIDNIGPIFEKSPYFLRRSKDRWKRHLLLKWKINRFHNKPFYGRQSYLEPLKTWNVPIEKSEPGPQFFSKSTLEKVKPILPQQKFIIFAPSAAWTLKQWPQIHWKALIQSLKDIPILLLGGKNDHFLWNLGKEYKNVQILAGETNLSESCAIISQSVLLVSGDTGLLHAADYLGVPNIALIGPTAFGYPNSKTSNILEVEMPCKPCSKDGRGRCTNSIHKKCLFDIRPEKVKTKINELL